MTIVCSYQVHIVMLLSINGQEDQLYQEVLNQFRILSLPDRLATGSIETTYISDAG